MIPSLIAAATILAVILILPAFPWPDIPSVIGDSLVVIFRYYWGLNRFIPLDTVTLLGFFALGIEVLLMLVRFIGRIFAFVSGHNSPFDNIGREK